MYGYCSDRSPASLISIRFCEFGAEQEDLGRVKDPYQNNYERARSPVGRRYITVSNIKADQMLADSEQQGRYSRAKPNFLPGGAPSAVRASPSSSAPIRREYPATSAARIAVRRRTGAMT